MNRKSAYVYCSSCLEVFFAREEVEDDVCPKCGYQGCLSERFTRNSLPMTVSPDMLPDGSGDMRSPLVKARDEWLASREGVKCCAGTAKGEYLKNRLVLAFLAGTKWAEKK